MLIPWRITLADMLCEEFVSAIEAFRDLVVAPSCLALDQIEPPLPENSVLKYEDYLRRLDGQTARKALALALAGMWETQFREHLWKSTAAIAVDQGMGPKIETANLKGMESIFKKLRGFQLSEVVGYNVIEGLILVANAARHGNGSSSNGVFEKYNRYYSLTKPFNGFLSYSLHGATQPEDVRYLRISNSDLSEFTEAMITFWKAIIELKKSGRDSGS